MLPLVGNTATVYIALEAWSFWEDKFLCLVEQGEVRAEKVIEAPGGYSGEGPLPIPLHPAAMISRQSVQSAVARQCLSEVAQPLAYKPHCAGSRAV